MPRRCPSAILPTIAAVPGVPRPLPVSRSTARTPPCQTIETHPQHPRRLHGNERDHALGKPTGQSDSDELPGRAEPDTKQAGKTASGVCFRDLFIKDFDHLGAKLAAKLVGI